MKLKYYLRGIGVGIIVTSLILYFTTSARMSNGAMSDDEVIARAKELGMIENVTLSNVSGNKTLSDNKVTTNNSDNGTQNKKENNLILGNDDKENNNNNNSSVSVGNVLVIEEKESPTPGNDPSPSVTPEKVVTPAPSVKPEPSISPSPSVSPKPSVSPSPSVNPTVSPSVSPSPSPVKENGNDDIHKTSITIIAGDSSYSAAKKLQSAGIVSSAAKFDEYLCKNGYDKHLVIGTHEIPDNATDEQIAKIITSK